MNLKWITLFISFVLSFSLFADQSLYCPQNHKYINVGMSQAQVIDACGAPISKQDSNQPVMQRVPVQQLIYNNEGTSTAFYGVWNLNTGSGGARLEIDIVNQQVRGIKLNGNDNNNISICGGRGIQVGDPIGKVYGLCGSPSLVNNTYINQMIPSTQKPEVWIYQPGQYQQSVTLTFVNGKLQSIN